MNIFITPTFESQLQEILEELVEHDAAYAKSFKMYLDTILLNMPTKVGKYKSSEFIDEDGVQEIEHKGLKIPFYHNKQDETFVVLGIIK